MERQGSVTGPLLHRTIRQNGFAQGITGDIAFETSTDRHFSDVGFNVRTYQNGAFVKVGSIATGNNTMFKDCDELGQEIGSPLSSECDNRIIFRGHAYINYYVYTDICIYRVHRSCIHTRFACCFCCLVADGTSEVPNVRVFGEPMFVRTHVGIF